MLRTTLATLALVALANAQSQTAFNIVDVASGISTFTVDTGGNIAAGGNPVWYNTGNTPTMSDSACAYVEDNLFGTDVAHYMPYGTSCYYGCEPGIHNSRYHCTGLSGYCDGLGHCCSEGACDTGDEQTMLTPYEWVTGFASPYDKNVYTMPYYPGGNAVICNILSFNNKVILNACFDDDTSCTSYTFTTGSVGSTLNTGYIEYNSSDRMVRLEVIGPNYLQVNKRDGEPLEFDVEERNVRVEEMDEVAAEMREKLQDDVDRRAPPTLTFPTFPPPMSFSYNRYYSYYRIECHYTTILN